MYVLYIALVCTCYVGHMLLVFSLDLCEYENQTRKEKDLANSLFTKSGQVLARYKAKYAGKRKKNLRSGL